ncbi:MAG: pyridoxal 5'-phosphate synthase glutaminase subunit PdxT [Thermaerobacter sp.]|nr:pyridoxal 5'-phosphate synthase glutaminase subunit PdxT [Thermaerobacter sp.]
MRVGVLAIQGNVREHKRHLARVGAEPVEVRRPSELSDLDGLILPGGESTTMSLLMEEYGLLQPLRERAQSRPFPIYGTCAGLILLATEVVGLSPARLGLMDIVADRNAYGRQVASFEMSLPIPVLGPDPFPAVFIRAPKIARMGAGVVALATYQGDVVMAEQGQYLVSAFHPEMSPDTRIHAYFVEKVRKARQAEGS